MDWPILFTFTELRYNFPAMFKSVSAPSFVSTFMKLLSLTAVMAIFLTSRLNAGDSVTISEFMAAGQYVVADEDGDYSDWLEIHNTGAAALDLSGWHLTDKPDARQSGRCPR